MNLFKVIFFSVVTVLFFGCANNSTNGVSRNSTDGLVDTPYKKQRIERVIKTRSNIASVYKNIIKKQGKYKYESNAEYIKSMNSFNAYAVMDIAIKKVYDPNRKIYIIKFDVSDESTDTYVKKYSKGKLYRPNYKESEKKRSQGLLSMVKDQSYNTMMSNAFGVTVKVKHYNRVLYKVYANNMKKLLSMKSIASYNKGGEYYSDIEYYIAIPVSKEKAMQLDKQKLKLKVGVQFINPGTSLSRFDGGKSATIDSPTSVSGSTYGFDGNINEFVLYNDSTKEILFQFVD